MRIRMPRKVVLIGLLALGGIGAGEVLFLSHDGAPTAGCGGGLRCGQAAPR
jgi:hypothetical protein